MIYKFKLLLSSELLVEVSQISDFFLPNRPICWGTEMQTADSASVCDRKETVSVGVSCPPNIKVMEMGTRFIVWSTRL